MSRNEVIQWSVVGIIILLAILWVALRILRLSRNKSSDSCSCCDSSQHCKVKDLKEEISKRRSENCRDGQSARN